MNLNFTVNRGDIYLVDLGRDNKIGSEQAGVRPVVIIQNDVGNTFSPTVIVATITSQTHKKKLPTQVLLGEDCGLLKPSMVMCEQTFTISKERLGKKIGTVTEEIMTYIDEALSISLELKKPESREVTIAKEKANSILELDKFVQMWLDKGKPIEAIYDFIEDRRIKLKDLERYCRDFNLNSNEYYKKISIHSGVVNNKIKMAV